MQDLNPSDLAFGLNLQPACRGMTNQLNINLNTHGNIETELEMVGRAGFKSFGFSLRPEPATSLSRYG
ncbi:hypothetical protein NFC79_12300 [Providencia stuartii]|nr:hypothetical protein NFC79_12300 [Providencia stuartii]